MSITGDYPTRRLQSRIIVVMRYIFQMSVQKHACFFCFHMDIVSRAHFPVDCYINRSWYLYRMNCSPRGRNHSTDMDKQRMKLELIYPNLTAKKTGKMDI